MKSEQLVR